MLDTKKSMHVHVLLGQIDAAEISFALSFDVALALAPVLNHSIICSQSGFLANFMLSLFMRIIYSVNSISAPYFVGSLSLSLFCLIRQRRFSFRLQISCNAWRDSVAWTTKWNKLFELRNKWQIIQLWLHFFYHFSGKCSLQSSISTANLMWFNDDKFRIWWNSCSVISGMDFHFKWN